MLKNHKKAKDHILKATKTEYNHLVEEAFLTVRQQTILLMNLANWQIGNELHLSVFTIDKELNDIYDKIAKVI